MMNFGFIWLLFQSILILLISLLRMALFFQNDSQIDLCLVMIWFDLQDFLVDISSLVALSLLLIDDSEVEHGNSILLLLYSYFQMKN